MIFGRVWALVLILGAGIVWVLLLIIVIERVWVLVVILEVHTQPQSILDSLLFCYVTEVFIFSFKVDRRLALKMGRPPKYLMGLVIQNSFSLGQ